MNIAKFIFLSILICSVSEAQFMEFPTPTSSALYSGCTSTMPTFTTPRIWVCGANGTIYKGLMYPYNWINANGGLSPSFTFVSIVALDTSTAFVGGNNTGGSYIFKTTNGGTNWLAVHSQPGGHINAVWMRNATTGFAVGNPVGGRWSLWRTVNGGANWDSSGRYLPASGVETGFNNSLWCSGDTILFGTNNSRIYYSANYGLNWLIESTAPEVNSFSIHYNFNGNYVFWSSGSNSARSTTNNGINWTQYQPLPGSGNIYGLADPNCGVLNEPLSNPPNVFYARSNQVYANDWQIGWYLFYTAPSGNYTMLFKKRNEPPPRPDCMGTSIVGIRDNGGVSLCGCSWGEVKNISSEIPESYMLSQNYPNPFNPVTYIEFSVPRKSQVEMVVVNALGEEIAVLVNEVLSAGNYSVDWDASTYPSGVYFYKLVTGEFSQTKKMVLIK